MAAPWQISVTGFWLPALANFVKDGGILAPYSDMAVPYFVLYIGFLDLRHRQRWFALNFGFLIMGVELMPFIFANDTIWDLMVI